MRGQYMPCAICSHCGHIYKRKIWRHTKQSGKVRCGVRTCFGTLWVINDKELGIAVGRLDREKRIVQAKLHVLKEKVDV